MNISDDLLKAMSESVTTRRYFTALEPEDMRKFHEWFTDGYCMKCWDRCSGICYCENDE